MKALVMGGSGFMGQHLVRALCERGDDVLATFHSKASADIAWAKWRYADLTLRKYHDMLLLDRPDVVFVCAGVTGGVGAIGMDPMSFVVPNLLIHTHAFGACLAAGVKKIICVSSTTGYPDSDLPMHEDDYFLGDVHPGYFNPGHTRRFIERLGQMYAERGLEITNLRPANVYGPGDNFDPQTSHVIAASVRKVAEKQDPITIWGNGENVRDAIYITDMVRALLLAAESPAGAYNLGVGYGMSINEIVQTLLMEGGYEPRIVYDESRPSLLKQRALNINRAREVLGWVPRVQMQEGLWKTLEWFRANS